MDGCESGTGPVRCLASRQHRHSRCVSAGKMMIATKLTQTRKLLVVEDWAVQPIQLNDVKKQS